MVLHCFTLLVVHKIVIKLMRYFLLLQEDTREFIGELKVKVIRGINLAVRDLLTSDPYVILNLGRQVS